jgi:hypothetical protein
LALAMGPAVPGVDGPWSDCPPHRLGGFFHCMRMLPRGRCNSIGHSAKPTLWGGASLEDVDGAIADRAPAERGTTLPIAGRLSHASLLAGHGLAHARQHGKRLGLSQSQFASRFGSPPTLRNWEQGRSHPDAPTRVLLAVIAKHPEAVEDVLRKAS